MLQRAHNKEEYGSRNLEAKLESKVAALDAQLEAAQAEISLQAAEISQLR